MSPSTSSTYDNGLLTVTTTTAALGVASGFDFSVAGYLPPNADFAPNDPGTWRYSLGRATPNWPPFP